MAEVNTGYLGIAVIGSSDPIRCSDFGMEPQQEVSYYDHVIGLNDTIPGGAVTKGESPGVIQTQRKYWRPSPITIGGGVGYPAAVEDGGSVNIDPLFSYAKYGNYFNTTMKYFCGGGRVFTNCRVNTFGITAMAGDIVNISADIMAGVMDDSDSVERYDTSQKLVTWEKVFVSVSGASGGITTDAFQGFELNINNNCNAIHTASPSGAGVKEDLLPADLRLGTQEVTGSLYIYRKQGEDFLTDATGLTTITLTIADFSTEIFCVLKPKQIPASVGPVIISIPFSGVDKAFGE